MSFHKHVVADSKWQTLQEDSDWGIEIIEFKFTCNCGHVSIVENFYAPESWPNSDENYAGFRAHVEAELYRLSQLYETTSTLGRYYDFCSCQSCVKIRQARIREEHGCPTFEESIELTADTLWDHLSEDHDNPL